MIGYNWWWCLWGNAFSFQSDKITMNLKANTNFIPDLYYNSRNLQKCKILDFMCSYLMVSACCNQSSTCMPASMHTHTHKYTCSHKVGHLICTIIIHKSSMVDDLKKIQYRIRFYSRLNWITTIYISFIDINFYILTSRFSYLALHLDPISHRDSVDNKAMYNFYSALF